jgi:hypothetical protein
MAALGVPLPLTAGAEATAATKTNVLFAPPSYTICAARVARSGLGFDHVFWRLDREAFVKENDPGLRVILRLPLPASHLSVSAQMVATRYANLFGAGFRAAIRDLPSAMRDFFTGGTPIAATADWNLSREL